MSKAVSAGSPWLVPWLESPRVHTWNGSEGTSAQRACTMARALIACMDGAMPSVSTAELSEGAGVEAMRRVREEAGRRGR